MTKELEERIAHVLEVYDGIVTRSNAVATEQTAALLTLTVVLTEQLEMLTYNLPSSPSD
jgi:hypothetical protein